MKKILLLGGSYSQVPAIRKAKERGMYVITCDYLPNNPGHKLADEYYNISTTHKEAVLCLAKKLKVNYIMAYASDPAAPVAAYISQSLGLPGNLYSSIRVLAEKDLFRNFLSKNGFNTPGAFSIGEDEKVSDKISLLKFPVVVKPTDSSGNKGVTKVTTMSELDYAVNYAFSYSRNKRIIVEEFIDNDLADIHGDGFVIEGELKFTCLGDHIYSSKGNPFTPSGTIWPSLKDDEIINQVTAHVSEIIKKTGFKNGPINIEARVNSKGKIYIMEIGPRNGGHFVPQAITYCTGVDLVGLAMDAVSGIPIKNIQRKFRKHSAYYAIHSETEGVLKNLSVHPKLHPFLKEFHQYIFPGEKIERFRDTRAAIGILLLQFSNSQEMLEVMKKIHTYTEINLE